MVKFQIITLQKVKRGEFGLKIVCGQDPHRNKLARLPLAAKDGVKKFKIRSGIAYLCQQKYKVAKLASYPTNNFLIIRHPFLSHLSLLLGVRR